MSVPLSKQINEEISIEYYPLVESYKLFVDSGQSYGATRLTREQLDNLIDCLIDFFVDTEPDFLG